MAHTNLNTSTGDLLTSAMVNSLLMVDGSGNVGIGTSSPSSALEVNGNVDVGGGTTSDVRMKVSVSGATADPKMGLQITGVRDYFWRIDNSDSDKMILDTNGTDIVTIDSSGIITMSAYGAGTATFSAAGVISSVSDKNVKIDDGELTLAQSYNVLKVDPRYFYFKDDKGNALKDERHLGFYAQDIANHCPEAAPHSIQYDEEGNKIKDAWGIYDRSMIAVHHKIIQNQQTLIESLQAEVKAFQSLSERLTVLETAKA